MYSIYLLISETGDKSYVGFTNDIGKRIRKHKDKQVKSTKYFGKFRCFIIENIDNIREARIREKYWKSCAGRKKLKYLFDHGPIV